MVKQCAAPGAEGDEADAVKCDRCGACCRWLEVKAEVGHDDRIFLLRRGCLIDSGHAYIPSRCPKLDYNPVLGYNCSIYNQRPLACRVFRPGSTSCAVCRHAEGLQPLGRPK